MCAEWINIVIILVVLCDQLYTCDNDMHLKQLFHIFHIIIVQITLILINQEREREREREREFIRSNSSQILIMTLCP